MDLLAVSVASSVQLLIDFILNFILFDYLMIRCDEDIDECAPEPCQNNGTCSNLIGRYECNCAEDFVGVDCERPRVVTCANAPCKNGANCTDNEPSSSSLSVLRQLQTLYNYTCHCPFGYEGVNCEMSIDYCLLLNPCRNGAFCTSVFFEPVNDLQRKLIKDSIS
jgi:protein crumbs